MTLTAANFSIVQGLVERKSAIVLSDGKEYLVQARLESLVRKKGLLSLKELFTSLHSAPDGPLAEEVVDALTTNETSFFRDGRPFEGLRTTILPDLIAKRRSVRTLSIWCGACSSGQEPYTLAMLLLENFPELLSWRLEFIVSDYSPEMLERCKAARYAGHEIKRGLPEDLIAKYFDADGSKWRAKPELRSMLDVRRINLMNHWSLPMMDLVMMRNVLIYFSPKTKAEILGRVRETLRPDGYLMLGAAETTINIDNAYEGVDCGPARCYKLRAR